MVDIAASSGQRRPLVWPQHASGAVSGLLLLLSLLYRYCRPVSYSCGGKAKVTIKVTIQLGPEDGPWFADLLRSVGDAEITVLGPEQHSEPQTSPLQERHRRSA